MWADDISDASQSTTVLSGQVDRSYDDVMKYGAILHIPDMSNPAVRVKSADTTATWAAITETKQDLTINRQAYVAILVEDIAEIQSNTPIRESYAGKAGYSLTAYIEGDATAGLASLPSAFSQSVGAAGTDFNEDDLLDAIRYLDDGDVPESDRFFYVSPSGNTNLLKLDMFRSSLYVGDAAAQDATQRAKVGTVLGAPVFKSSLANNNPSSSNSSWCWFAHKRAVALVMQRTPTIHTQYILLETGFGFLCDTIYQFVERHIAPSTLGGGSSDDRFAVAVGAR